LLKATHIRINEHNEVADGLYKIISRDIVVRSYGIDADFEIIIQDIGYKWVDIAYVKSIQIRE
jgi:hypothetical protein